MSDLRTRIAAVLAAHQRDEGEPSGYCLCGEIVFSDEETTHQADAVIRELKLAREGSNQACIDAGLPIRYRYVTEWEDDE